MARIEPDPAQMSKLWRVRRALRDLPVWSTDAYKAVTAYAMASDQPGRATALRAEAAASVAALSTAEKAAVNAVLSEVGAEGVS